MALLTPVRMLQFCSQTKHMEKMWNKQCDFHIYDFPPSQMISNQVNMPLLFYHGSGESLKSQWLWQFEHSQLIYRSNSTLMTYLMGDENLWQSRTLQEWVIRLKAFQTFRSLTSMWKMKSNIDCCVEIPLWDVHLPHTFTCHVLLASLQLRLSSIFCHCFFV